VAVKTVSELTYVLSGTLNPTNTINTLIFARCSIIVVCHRTVDECRQLTVYPTLSQPHVLLGFTDIVVMYCHIVSLISVVTITDVECRRVLFDRPTTITSLLSLLAVAYQGNLL